MYRKTIVYDRKSKDFAMYLNGELIGYAPTYLQAEATLNRLVYELILSDDHAPEALVMMADADSPPGESPPLAEDLALTQQPEAEATPQPASPQPRKKHPRKKRTA